MFSFWEELKMYQLHKRPSLCLSVYFIYLLKRWYQYFLKWFINKKRTFFTNFMENMFGKQQLRDDFKKIKNKRS